ncbi:MAG: hypothetical protein KDD56_03480 [Bdellovibrionales bacterium]|nr:hypothetical protein [Bdellovibrionales bacterium]
MLKDKSTDFFAKPFLALKINATKASQLKEIALEECVRNFKTIHKNIDCLDFFHDLSHEPYLARLNDMSLYMQDQSNICLETALADITGIILRIFDFAEKNQLVPQITKDCQWNPLIPQAFKALFPDSIITRNYNFIHNKIRKL